MDHHKPNAEFFNAPLEIFSYNGMPYRRLGKTGLWASNIGLGTWKFGYPESGDGSRVGRKLGFEIFDRAVELGATFWDTAPRYHNASGNSERLIGEWLKTNPDQRRNIVIATKVYGGMDGLTPNHCRLTRLNIKESVYASLERMGISAIDLLYFHHYDPVTPPEESFSAVIDLQRQDLVRYIGISNFTLDQLRIHNSMESIFGNPARIAVVQNQYDMLRREHPDYQCVLSAAKSLGISFVPYSPLAEGYLTERYLDLSTVSNGDRLVDQGTLESVETRENRKKLIRLAALAAKWGLPLSQLTLAYTLTIEGMGPMIPGASSVEQLESNAQAGKILLDEDQKMKIRKILVKKFTGVKISRL